MTKLKVALACLVVWVAVPIGLSETAHVWFQEMDVVYIYLANLHVLALFVVIQIVYKVLVVVEILRSRRHTLNAETKNKKQKDLAKTVMILIVILIDTAFPFVLATQIYHLYFYFRLDYQMIVQFRCYYGLVFILNLIANPVVYSLRLNDYRRSLVALFFCKCRNGRRINIQQRSTR